MHWIAVAIATVVVLAAAPAHAVLVKAGPATSAALEVQRLAEEGRLAEADTRFQRALASCRPGDEGAPCRAQLGFTGGTLGEVQAASDPARRAHWLGVTAARYEKVLVDAPADAPTLKRLTRVYSQQGNAAKGEALLTDAARRFPNDEAIALLVGDFARDARRWDEAIRAYRFAMDRHPTSDPARRRLVQAYVALLPARLDELRRVLAEVERGFPAIAEAGHRAIIDKFHRTDPAWADESLVSLVRVLAGMRRLGPQSLDTLPLGWAPPALVELRAYVTSPQQRPPSGWWRGRPDRRHVLALGGLALGNQALLEADPAGAAARWETAEDFAPEYELYAFDPVLRGLPVVRLDLQTALALHYFKFPSLDPGERKFSRVINAIFQSKIGAYQLDDLEGIQRHHTILGMIFAQKGVWTSSHAALNAIFQLDNALKTAKRRDTKDRSYQPLPELRAELARGYQAVNDVRNARAAYLEAARAYLDSDAVDRARDMLTSSAPMITDGSAERDLATQLGRIIETRTDVARASGAQLDPSAGGYAFRENGRHAWLYGQPLGGGLPTDFLDRQRFKTLADLAVHLDGAGRAQTSADLAARALRTAIDKLPALSGFTDVARIERIRRLATQRRVLDQRPLVQGVSVRPPGGDKTWKVTDPATLRPTEVRLDADDVLAVRIVQELGADATLRSTEFVVNGGQVTVREAAKSDEAKSRIETLSGADTVRVAPTLPARPLAAPAWQGVKR